MSGSTTFSAAAVAADEDEVAALGLGGLHDALRLGGAGADRVDEDAAVGREVGIARELDSHGERRGFAKNLTADEAGAD